MFEFKLKSSPELKKWRDWMNGLIEAQNRRDCLSYNLHLTHYLRNEKLEKFWMCLVEGSSTSSFKHSSEHSARTEAERLSRQLDKKVFVLEATDYVEVQKPVVWQKTQEIPF